MQSVYMQGIDPGLVDTGIVSLAIVSNTRTIYHGEAVVTRGGGAEVASLAQGQFTGHVKNVFVEAYRPRSHFSTDQRMVELVAEIRKAIPGSKVLPNTGAKKLVKPKLLNLFGINKFSTSTHHADLLSAARILMLGAYKDPALNTIVADVVKAALDGSPWEVRNL